MQYNAPLSFMHLSKVYMRSVMQATMRQNTQPKLDSLQYF